MTYHFLKICIKLISVIPFRMAYVLSDVIGFLLYYMVRYRRKIVRKNLTECFPEKSLTEIKRIECKFYRHFSDSVVESCKMASMSVEEMERRMRFPNIEAVNAVLRSGQSVSLYIGHYANWEWLSSMPLHLEKGVVAAQIYHRLSNNHFNRLMLDIRGRMGAVNVEMRKTARFITEQVSQGHECIVGFIADQSPRKKDVHYFLPFMNHKTPVNTGTEKVTKHYGFDAWFVNTKKVRRGFYEAEFIHMHDNPETLPDFALTDIYYKLLEQTIRRQPELYLWTHNRFKYAESTEINHT